jgi:glycosyltransferase involved in cell wall biosynthesis
MGWLINRNTDGLPSKQERGRARGHGRKEETEHVYIPFDQCKSIGGPATFLKNLKGYMDEIGFSYVDNLRKASLILFPISYDLRSLKRFKKRGGIICQRLDGIYYPGKHGSDSVRRNEKIKKIYTDLADHVIFQSEYSRAQCFDMFGPLSKAAYSIVINGVNTDVFNPDTERVFNQEQIHFCTSSNFRNADMLVPVIQALDLIYPKVDFVFHVIGPIRGIGILKGLFDWTAKYQSPR